MYRTRQPARQALRYHSTQLLQRHHHQHSPPPYHHQQQQQQQARSPFNTSWLSTAKAARRTGSSRRILHSWA